MKYVEGKGFQAETKDGVGVFDEDKVCDIFPPLITSEEYVTYYFDADDGNDGQDGITPTTPKRTLEAVETLIANATKQGVRIALKGGCVFQGDLTICGETDEAHPYILTSYGKGRAVIDGKNEVLTVRCSNVVIDGIEVTGREAFRGIFVQTKQRGALKNIVIKNCYVHDINFLWYLDCAPCETDPDEVDVDRVCPEYYSGTKTYYRYNRRSHGGIIFLNDTDENVGASWFENIFVTDNRIENVARTGLYFANVWADKAGIGFGRNRYVQDAEYALDTEKGLGYFRSKNLVCSSNVIVCAGGDGMILASVYNVFSEHNVCNYANYLGRTGYWNAGLWLFDAECVWFRYNESAYTYMRHNSNDAQGFDFDNACVKVVFKGNYAHHNEGGGLLVCNSKTSVKLHDELGNVIGTTEKTVGNWYDNLVCCNLFYENGNTRDATRSAFITIAREVDYLFAYSNFVVLRDDIEGQSIINTEDESQYTYKHFYWNNVFYCPKRVEARYTIKMLKNSSFEGNIYKNVGDFSEWETPNDELPLFFKKETQYGLITRSRTITKAAFSKKVEKYIKIYE